MQLYLLELFKELFKVHLELFKVHLELFKLLFICLFTADYLFRGICLDNFNCFPKSSVTSPT